MNKFGRKSQENLATIHPSLAGVIEKALFFIDIGVLEGKRTTETQEEYFRSGKSKTMDSKHLEQEDGYSHAGDLGVYVNGKLTWEPRYYYFLAGIMKKIAHDSGVDIRWGGDWDKDLDFEDQSFNDLVHFELIK